MFSFLHAASLHMQGRGTAIHLLSVHMGRCRVMGERRVEMEERGEEKTTKRLLSLHNIDCQR